MYKLKRVKEIVMINLIKNFRIELLRLRKKRGSKFLFVPKNNFKLLATVLAYEIVNNTQKADQFLLAGVLLDLVQRQVIVKKSVKRNIFKLGSFTYYDIQIMTFDNEYYSRGTSTNEMEAYAKALGEVFERFTLRFYTGFEMKNTYFSDPSIQSEILPYSQYPQPTPSQLDKMPIFRVDENLDKFNFVKLPDIKSDEKKYILTQALSTNSEILSRKKIVIFSTTNGAGAGYNASEARSSALMELIHRHYFLDSWFSKEVNRKIVLSNDVLLKTNLGKKIHEFSRKGFKMHFVDLTENSKVPTVLCVLEKLGGWYMGGASKSTLYKACERSLDEALSIFTWKCRENISGVKMYSKSVLENMPSGFTDPSVTSILKVSAFANSYFTKNFDQFFISGPEYIPTTEELLKETNLKEEDCIPGPVFEYVYKTNLLEDYDYCLIKCYAPHTQFFSLEEVQTKPIIIGGREIVFDKISPFP